MEKKWEEMSANEKLESLSQRWLSPPNVKFVSAVAEKEYKAISPLSGMSLEYTASQITAGPSRTVTTGSFGPATGPSPFPLPLRRSDPLG